MWAPDFRIRGRGITRSAEANFPSNAPAEPGKTFIPTDKSLAQVNGINLICVHCILHSEAGETSLLLRTLGNTAELRILDFLLDNPKFDFSRKEIREAIGSTKRTLSEKIPKLEEQGLIRVSRKIGRAKLYKINLENPAVQAFRTLERSLSLKIEVHSEAR